MPEPTDDGVENSAETTVESKGVVADAVVDLLGALAYGELSAFDHLADDARMAPTLTARA